MTSSSTPYKEKPHVLVVDNSLVDRKLIERLLASSAYKVTTAENGHRALEFLGLKEGEHRIDKKVLTGDIAYLPLVVMLKPFLLQDSEESSNLKEVPVLILSSENIATRIKKCLEGGAQGFMLKPLEQTNVKKLRCHMMKTQPTMQQEGLCILKSIEHIQEQTRSRNS